MTTDTEKPLIEYNDFLPIQMEVNRVHLYMQEQTTASIEHLTTRIEKLERENTVQDVLIFILFVVCAGLSIGLRRATKQLENFKAE